MTILTNWQCLDNHLGINLNLVVSVGGAAVSVGASGDVLAYPVTTFTPKLGDCAKGSNNSEWMYVQAGTTVTAFNMLAISPGFSAQNWTAALALSNAYSYGVAEFQTVNGVSVGAATGGVANTSEFFWALMRANAGVRVNATGTLDPGADLYIAGSAGRIAGSSSIAAIASGGRLNGVMFLGSVSIDGSSNVPGNVNAEFGFYGYVVPAAQVAAITV